MKTVVYNQEGKKISQTLLPKEIFDVKMNSDLVHQVAVSQMANRRQVSAHIKTRAEVRGGGRKPWRQKGTGRARAGSIMREILDKLFLKKGSGLIALAQKDENIIKAARNIPKTETIQAKDLNVLDLLSSKYLVMPKEVIKVIKETFIK